MILILNYFTATDHKFNFEKFPTLIMEKSGSPPSKKDSEYKDNEGSGDSNEWSDISSSSDEGGNEGKLEKKVCPSLIHSFNFTQIKELRPALASKNSFYLDTCRSSGLSIL